MDYQIQFLSDLMKRTTKQQRQDFSAAVGYIFGRIDRVTVDSPRSEFNRIIRWIRVLVPKFLLLLLLKWLRYDALICFQQVAQERLIYGMISFQRHPKKQMIGMFDVYITPELRGKDLHSSLSALADMVYQMSQRFYPKFSYLQCGKNETTRRLLRLYSRINEKKYPQIKVSVDESRIYLAR